VKEASVAPAQAEAARLWKAWDEVKARAPEGV